MLLALSLALILEGVSTLGLILSWLLAINLFTLVFYSIDKLNAIWVGENAQRSALQVRVPEYALLVMALIGGSPAALLAILILPHKLRKTWFMLRFGFVLLLQAAIVYTFRERIAWPVQIL
jgi:uncharacterized membrane protein YsdA (DUF1294 family)